MTIDERQVARALKAYARGIDVSDADLDRLEEQVTDRLHGATDQSGRRRPWEWAVAACAVTALVLAGTALWRTRTEESLPASPPPTTITPADLAGAWLSEFDDSSGWIWHFSSAATLGTSNTAADHFTGNMDPETPFTLEPGDVINLSKDGLPCRATVRLAPEGRMTLRPVIGQNLCGLFDDGQDHPLIRVSPASVAGMAMVVSRQPWLERPATQAASMDDLSGTWLLQGTGTILVVGQGASSQDWQYSLDDGGGVEPDQRGTATVRPDGAVVLRPEVGAEQGCETVYSRVVTTRTMLEADLGDASCGRVRGTQDTWIRLN